MRLMSTLLRTSCNCRRFGYQEGWNILPGQGMPDDAAVKVSGAVGITIDNCAFDQVGGGGVHVANGSTSVVIQRSLFRGTGQSGVIFTGNSSRLDV